MSFYTSLTGLNAATAELGIVSNNIANVGTIGFKKSRAEFGDIFATSPLQNASSSIGQGVLLKGVAQEFSQGNVAFSQNSLDMAIQGQGFFVLKPNLTSNQTVYTRNGSFRVNNDRYVVDSSGQFVQVFPVNDDGSVVATGLDSAKSLQLPTTSGLPKASSKIDLGVNLPADAERLRPLIDECHALGVRVSLFMDPLPQAMVHARAAGAGRVELYTEGYARVHAQAVDACGAGDAASSPAVLQSLASYAAAAQAALQAGLGVNAGHDLNRDNLSDFLRAVPGVAEVSIGHALVADALELGYAATVQAYLQAIRAAYSGLGASGGGVSGART